MHIRFSGLLNTASTPTQVTPRQTAYPVVQDQVTFSGKGEDTQEMTADELFELGKDYALGRNGKEWNIAKACKPFHQASTWPNRKAVDVAKFYLSTNNSSDGFTAEEYLKMAVEYPTFDHSERFEVVDIYLQQGKKRAATNVLNRIAKEDPALAFQVGEIFATKLEAPEQTIRCFEMAVKKGAGADIPKVYDVLKKGLGALKPDPVLARQLEARYPNLCR